MVLKWFWTNTKRSLPGERMDSKTFKKMKDVLYRTAKNQNFCKNLISPKYLKESILRAKYIVISMSNNNTLQGFAIFDILEESLHIFLICSEVKGVGTEIMDAILEYSNTLPHIKYVNLESVSESQGFYLKKGFELYCPDGGVCPMIYVKNK